MSNYTKSTNFATKDTLPTGDSAKIVKGTEIDTEFNAIASAISSKADSASPTFTGTPAAPTATAGTNTTQIATTAFVVAERDTSATLTNKTLTSPTVSGLSLSDSSIVFEGSTANDFETTLTVTDPTADRTITLPNSTGTVALTTDLPSNTSLTSGSGTYSIAGTTMTISDTAHGLTTGYQIYCNFTSGTAVDNYFTVTVVDANTFTIAYGSSLTASGNVSWYYSPKGLISIASSDEVLAGTNTDRAVTPAGVLAAVRASLVQETAKTSTSGTSVDFTSIPSWVKRVTVLFNGVSLNGSSEITIQLGYGSTPTYKTTDYIGNVNSPSGATQVAFTNGFQVVSSGSSSEAYYGAAYITNFSSNTWIETSEISSAVDTTGSNGAGAVDLGATLTAIRVTTLNGTDTFDAGSINILYE